MSEQIGNIISSAGKSAVYYKEPTEHMRGGVFWVGHDGDNYHRFFGEDEEYQTVDEFIDYASENGWFEKI